MAICFNCEHSLDDHKVIKGYNSSYQVECQIADKYDHHNELSKCQCKAGFRDVSVVVVLSGGE